MHAKNVRKWVRSFKFLLFLVLVSFNACIYSQSQVKNESSHTFRQSIAITQSFQKFDNFSSVNWFLNLNKISLASSVGVGVNRTFYQNRIFPQVQLGLGYRLYSRTKFSVSPEISVLLSSFSSSERHYFSSFHVGYFMQYGSKWVFVHRLNAGLLNEKFINSFDHLTSANTIGWQFTLGIGYAFN
jgi:hypothetical protein